MPEKIDRYQIIDTLGQGGFAIVYLAHDPRLNRHVSLKLLKQAPEDTAVATPTASATPKTAQERFEEEVKILVQLEFDGVVRIYDYGNFEGRPYLVMHYMPGGNLADKLAGKPLSIIETAVILNRLCATLDRVHQHNTIHRDLKPLNILFDADDVAYLSDFGIARLAENSSSTASIGTPHYMAPEQFNDDPLTVQTDIYQMGVILFEMLTGETPFNAATHAAVMQKVLNEATPSALVFNPALKPAYDDVIKIAMAKAAHDRYQSAMDLARHFEALVYNHHLPVGLPPVPANTPPLELTSFQADDKKTKLAWIVTAVLLIPLLFVSFLLIQRTLNSATADPTSQPQLAAEQPNLNVVLVTATGQSGAEPAIVELVESSTPHPDFEATITAEAFALEAQILQATQTAVAQRLEPTLTNVPTSEPTATRIAAISTEDVLATRLDAPVFIDGDLSDWPPLIPVKSEHIVYQHDSWDGREDLAIHWQLAWDDRYLYVGVTAVDNLHVQTQTGNQIFKGDSISLQIDTDRDGDFSDHVSPDDFQIDISPGDFATIPPSAHRFQGNDTDWLADAPGHAIIVNAQFTEDGYTLEAAIPWADLGFFPYGGETLGLALNATDTDTPDTAVQELFISNVAGRQFNTPNSWGTLTLQSQSITRNQLNITNTPRPFANLIIEDFEYSSAASLENEYWINSPGNEVEMQLTNSNHATSGQQALAVTYQLKRDTNDYIGIERNLLTPMDWSDYGSICFWLNNANFEGFLIFQFKEQGSETWKYQTPLSPGTNEEICLQLNDDVFSIDSDKFNNLLELTAVDNYAIYLGDGGVTEGTIYIDSIQLKP